MVDNNQTEELEYCPTCMGETKHRVIHKTMKDGRPLRQGVCTACSMGPRALPKRCDKPPEDYCFHIGKYEGKTFKDVPSDYLQWAMDEMDIGFANKRRIHLTLQNRLAASKLPKPN